MVEGHWSKLADKFSMPFQKVHPFEKFFSAQLCRQNPFESPKLSKGAFWHFPYAHFSTNTFICRTDQGVSSSPAAKPSARLIRMNFAFAAFKVKIFAPGTPLTLAAAVCQLFPSIDVSSEYTRGCVLKIGLEAGGVLGVGRQPGLVI